MQYNNRKWLFANVLKVINNSSTRLASHYDVLEITPKANQSEIKSAYYKLSMRHHPDKTNDHASTKQFRAITEAYEILGNVKLKRMYDKGLLGGLKSSHTPEPEPVDPSLKFYKSRDKRQVAPTMTDGRTPIYDFDAWSKNHYSYIFEKSQGDKVKVKAMRDKIPEKAKAVKQEAQLFMLALILVTFIAFVMQGTEDLDKTTTQDTDTKS